MKDQLEDNYSPLPEPIPITEHKWSKGTIPLVTTRTLAYNHEKYIRECLDGILMQKTTFPVLVLIHDDASTDNTASIIRDYENKFPNTIKAYYQTENTHTKPNKLELRKDYYDESQKGKYIALCEGDDYWTDPLKLQKQVDFLDANPEYSATGHQTEIIFQNNPDKKALFSSHHNRIITIKQVIQSNVFHTNSLVCRRDALFRYDMGKSGHIVEQTIFILLAQSGKFYYFPDIMSVYRRNSTSISGTTTPEKAYKGQISWIKATKNILGSKFFWGYNFLTSKVHLHYLMHHPDLFNQMTKKKYYYFFKYILLVILMYPRNIRSVIRLLPDLLKTI